MLTSENISEWSYNYDKNGRVIKNYNKKTYINQMSRILTGIQATGTPHLGNLLGAIIPAIELSKKSENESFLFIANMHSLTQIKNAEELRQNTYEIAAAWLACGFRYRKNLFLQTK